MVENSELLITKAYRLGLDVGYFRHVEETGWVRRELITLHKLSKHLGVLDRVSKAYVDGKKRGTEKRNTELYKSFTWHSFNLGKNRSRGIEQYTSQTEAPRPGRGVGIIGLATIFLGIMVLVLSVLEVQHFDGSMYMSQDSPTKIRSLLNIPKSFLIFGAMSGLLMISAGFVKYLKDISVR